MNRRIFILLTSLCLLTVVQSCRRLPVLEEEDAALSLYLECPYVAEQTKSSMLFPGTDAENALHSLKIWIFDSSTKQLVSEPLSLTLSQLPSAGRVRHYSLPVTRDFARNKPNVDVFAVANGESIGFNLDETASWNDLDDALVGRGSFGTSSLVKAVPDAGLPMSAVARNLQVLGEEPVLKLETITLERAVSKLRFLFCRMENELNNDVITIDNIRMSGDIIPKSEYLFRRSGTGVTVPTSGYESGFNLVSVPFSPIAYEKPESFVYAGQDAVSYEKLIDNAIEKGQLTDGGTFYLKESDKALEGYIDYTINGKQSESGKKFQMSVAGDFARNSTWVVYGYFLSGRNLQISVRSLPWDYSFWNVDFSNESVSADQLSINAQTVIMSEVSKDNWDVYLKPGVSAKCSVRVYTPVSGKLMIEPKGDAYAFIVTPEKADIDASKDIEIEIRRNPEAEGDLTGKFITLTFSVEIGNREMDANSEILPNGLTYRFIL